MRRVPARLPGARLAGQRGGQRHDPPAEPDPGRSRPVRGAHADLVRADGELPGIEHVTGRHGPPRAAVHPVPLDGRSICGVVGRRGDLEVLLGRGGTPLRGSVAEITNRALMPPVRADSGARQPAHGAPEDPERERGGPGLDHLGRGLGDPQAAARVGGPGAVLPGRERRGRRAGRRGAVFSAGRAALPGVSHLEAEQLHPAGQPGRVPGQAGRRDQRAGPGATADPQRAAVHGCRDGRARAGRRPGGRGRACRPGAGRARPRRRPPRARPVPGRAGESVRGAWPLLCVQPGTAPGRQRVNAAGSRS